MKISSFSLKYSFFFFLGIIYFLSFINFTMNLSRFLVCSLPIWLLFKWVWDEFQSLSVEGCHYSEASLAKDNPDLKGYLLQRRKGSWECVGEEVRVRIRYGGVSEGNHMCRT